MSRHGERLIGSAELDGPICDSDTFNLDHSGRELLTERFIENSGINQGHIDVPMAQELLQRGNRHAVIDQHGGQGVAQPMA